jgi:hypothetical protein
MSFTGRGKGNVGCRLRDGRQHIEEVYEERWGGHFIFSVTPVTDEEGATIGVSEGLPYRAAINLIAKILAMVLPFTLQADDVADPLIADGTSLLSCFCFGLS